MDNLTVVGSVALITLLGAISPGPNFILTVRNSLYSSRGAGIFTGIGTACGSAVHVMYSIAGVSLLISQTPFIFTLIKILGAGYLIYLGVTSCVSKHSSMTIHPKKEHAISKFQAFKMGFLCNLLNPKAPIFFLGLFSVVIGPDTSYWLLVLITGIMMIENISWFSFVALCFSHERVRSVFDQFQHVFHTALGGLLILLGIKVAFSKL